MGINFDKNKTVLTNLLIMPMNVPYMPFNPTNEKVTKKLLRGWLSVYYVKEQSFRMEPFNWGDRWIELPHSYNSEETCYAEREAVTSNPSRITKVFKKYLVKSCWLWLKLFPSSDDGVIGKWHLKPLSLSPSSSQISWKRNGRKRTRDIV